MALTDEQLAKAYPSMFPAKAPGEPGIQADAPPPEDKLRQRYPSMFPAVNAAENPGAGPPGDGPPGDSRAKDREAWRSASQAEFDAEALEAARQVVTDYGDHDLRVLLGRGLGDHPAMVRLLARIGSRLRTGDGQGKE
jgi:hypothetical protein